MNYNKINFNDNNSNMLKNYEDCDFSQLSVEEFNSIKLECNNYANVRAASIEALKIVQKNHGWVSDHAIVLIAKILCIPVADIEGVATFYNQIFRKPVGKYIVRYCDSVVCYITGCKTLQITLEDFLNIKIGETTQDKKFTLLPTCCLGRCDAAPIIMINEDIYSNVVSSNIIKLLSLYT